MAPPEPSSPSLSISTRLGWVAFLNDCAGEVLARMLPLYLTVALGSSPALVGVVEGVAESAAVFLKGVSGWLSDRMPSRKGFVVGGYALSVAARALYLLTFTPALVGLSRVLERVGKGLRAAPRDAMIADAAAAGRSGRDFGVTRFLDTLGAMAGIALALAAGVGRGPMTAQTFRTCVWLALPLGLATVALLVVWVPRIPRATTSSRRLSWHVPREARGYLALVFLFALANSSDAFLVLRARQAGFSIREILGVFLLFNLLAASLALPVGRLSDRYGRVPFLAMGWAVYAAAYAVMGTATSPAPFAAALLGYGAFYGFTEGVEKALLADLLPAASRGTGFGALQSVLGLGALVSSPLMGLLMARAGARVAFGVEAALALAAMAGLLAWNAVQRKAPRGGLSGGR
ncbi:MFS transporter [Mesoterricola silvestris]|uniref:MFS transporter n=1 Tax=Mesoterricola silvestris TaxID=2927979 RepID=A0AA48GN44_9BACT|nr:MFS transporter [Mesoterricola silvestris]BDU71055.1 MFS transporter [Mesoterricola silvestris]